MSQVQICHEFSNHKIIAFWAKNDAKNEKGPEWKESEQISENKVDRIISLICNTLYSYYQDRMTYIYRGCLTSLKK